MPNLEGKVAVITGAGRGIGRASAELFARHGASVVIAERDEALGREVEASIRAGAGEALFVPADVADPEQVRQVFRACDESYGALHILYNNASVFLGAQDGPVSEVEERVWERVLAINLSGTFYCCKYGIPLIERSGGGAVILTSSSAGVMGIPGCDAYTATKGAAIALTRSMAVEYGPRGIRVNCIAPAGVDTEMLRESSTDNPDFDPSYFFARAPLGRFGLPGEVAEIALFLASDAASYVNGAIVRADGGITVTPIS